MKIEELGLPRGLQTKLTERFADIEELTARNARELQGLPGIGPGAITRLEEALDARGLSLAVDPHEPYDCAREGRPVGDANLTGLWLCDGCADQFEAVAFGGTPPEFTSSPMGGYCVNCVEPHPSVRLRQWFLCGVCGRVARSFGRSIVAARRLTESWAEVVEPATGVELEDVDPPVLRRRNAQTIAEKVAAIDFVGRRNGVPVFGFEMKVGPGGIGPGSVKPMAEFQLDCSDCDDITAVSIREDLPVYLVHGQVVSRASPPTPTFVPIGYWWADPFAMREHFKRTQTRQRETRMAAYYNPAMFAPLRDVVQHIQGGGPDALRQRIALEGFPALYDV